MRIIEKGDGIKKGSIHEIIQGNNDTCLGGNDVRGERGFNRYNRRLRINREVTLVKRIAREVDWK